MVILPGRFAYRHNNGIEGKAAWIWVVVRRDDPKDLPQGGKDAATGSVLPSTTAVTTFEGWDGWVWDKEKQMLRHLETSLDVAGKRNYLMLLFLFEQAGGWDSSRSFYLTSMLVAPHCHRYLGARV